MKAIELETIINQSGTLQIPLDYQQYYGKSAKIIVLLPDIEIEKETVVDLMPFAGTLDWQVDGLTYQQNSRQEWDR